MALSQDDRQAESRRVWAEVKRNSTRLNNCAGPHDFQPHDRYGTFVRTYRCTRCGGVVPSNAQYWYQRGLDHGRKESSVKPTSS